MATPVAPEAYPTGPWWDRGEELDDLVEEHRLVPEPARIARLGVAHRQPPGLQRVVRRRQPFQPHALHHTETVGDEAQPT